MSDQARAVDALIAKWRENTEDTAVRPSADHAVWLRHPVSSACRLQIHTPQYEELRAECVALHCENTALLSELESARRRAEYAERVAAHELARTMPIPTVRVVSRIHLVGAIINGVIPAGYCGSTNTDARTQDDREATCLDCFRNRVSLLSHEVGGKNNELESARREVERLQQLVVFMRGEADELRALVTPEGK